MSEETMDQIWGYPVNVLDGDTFDLDVDSQSRTNAYAYGDIERIRVHGRNAPELSRPGGVAARARLSSQILGHRVRIDVHTRDVYGRIVGDVDTNP